MAVGGASSHDVHDRLCVSGKHRLKCLQQSLGCLLDSRGVLEHFPQQQSSSAGPLLSVLVHRLQAVLKQMVAASMKKR